MMQSVKLFHVPFTPEMMYRGRCVHGCHYSVPTNLWTNVRAFCLINIAIHQPSASTCMDYSLYFIFRNPYRCSASEENILSDAFFQQDANHHCFLSASIPLQRHILITQTLRNTLGVLAYNSIETLFKQKGLVICRVWMGEDESNTYNHTHTHIYHISTFKQLRSQYLMIFVSKFSLQ